MDPSPKQCSVEAISKVEIGFPDLFGAENGGYSLNEVFILFRLLGTKSSE